MCRAANAADQRERRAKAKKAIAAAEADAVVESDNVRPLRRRNPLGTVVGGDVLNGRAKAGQKRLGKAPSGPVTPPEPPEQPEPPEDDMPGLVEAGVIEACENSTVAKERPDLVAQARRLAVFMDNPLLQKDYPRCSHQLSNLMTQLKPALKTKSKGRLVTIQKMTNRVPVQQARQKEG